MVVNVHILYLFSHCVSFALLIIDFIVILHVRLIRVLLKISQSIDEPRATLQHVRQWGCFRRDGKLCIKIKPPTHYYAPPPVGKGQ